MTLFQIQYCSSYFYPSGKMNLFNPSSPPFLPLAKTLNKFKQILKIKDKKLKLQIKTFLSFALAFCIFTFAF